MAESVRKNARIVEIRDSILVLELCTHEACASCAVKGMCGTDSQSKTKLIELQNDGMNRNVGDEVILLISSSIGLKGAFLAYFLPVIAVLVTIIILQRFLANDLFVGMIAISVLVVYFVLLWLFRKNIEKHISITIE